MNKISNQKGLRRRSFEIIRKPDLVGSSFLFNNVRVAYVGTNPENNISFYVNNGQGGVIGVSVYPDGRKVLKNATTVKGYEYSHGNAGYLQFKDAFGHGKHILASHAVYMAWRKKEIPAGMTIDHIDGCTTNNYIVNLRCVSNAINNRDGGFLRKLRNKGITPTTIQRPYLLRYFDRMAILKPAIKEYRYKHLTRTDLEIILYSPDPFNTCSLSACSPPTCSLSACSFSPHFTPQREQPPPPTCSLLACSFSPRFTPQREQVD